MKLEFKNVTKQYGEVNAVNKVNCAMEKGIYGLLGVNGCLLYTSRGSEGYVDIKFDVTIESKE